MNGTWIVPFKGRNYSGALKQNLLWYKDSIYVMDNHRAALWCWLQEVDLHSSHSLFHIDRHTDCLQSRLDEWLDNLPPSWELTIDEYLNHSYEWEMGTSPIFRWDNYLSIYFAIFGSNISKCYFATHNGGDVPNYSRVRRANLWDLPANLENWLKEEDSPWIVNIDLDYFFWRDLENPDMMVSEQFLSECFESLRRRIESGDAAVTTFSLTPSSEFTGGWENSERLARKVLGHLGIDFQLPV